MAAPAPVCDNWSAQTQLERCFSTKILAWINDYLGFMLDEDMFRPWLTVNKRFYELNRRALIAKTYSRNVDMILQNELGKTESFSRNALVFLRREPKIAGKLTKFHLDEELCRRVAECNRAAEAEQLALAETGMSITDVLLWNHIAGIEKVKQLWFNDSVRNALTQFFGLACIIEMCLTEPLYPRSPVHSVSQLIGELLVGMRRPEDRKNQMVVVLNQRSDMQSIFPRITTKLRENLTVIVAVAEAEQPQHSIHVYFTFVELIVRELPNAGDHMEIDPVCMGGVRNFLHLLRNRYLIEVFGGDPDLRFGSLMLMDIWRRFPDYMQSLFTQWDILLILLAMPDRQDFFDPSIVVQRFISLAGCLSVRHFQQGIVPANDVNFLSILGPAKYRQTRVSRIFGAEAVSLLDLDPSRLVLTVRANIANGSTGLQFSVESLQFLACGVQHIFNCRIQMLLDLEGEKDMFVIRTLFDDASVERPEESMTYKQPLLPLPEYGLQELKTPTSPEQDRPRDPRIDPRLVNSGRCMPANLIPTVFQPGAQMGVVMSANPPHFVNGGPPTFYPDGSFINYGPPFYQPRFGMMNNGPQFVHPGAHLMNSGPPFFQAPPPQPPEIALLGSRNPSPMDSDGSSKENGGNGSKNVQVPSEIKPRKRKGSLSPSKKRSALQKSNLLIHEIAERHKIPGLISDTAMPPPRAVPAALRKSFVDHTEPITSPSPKPRPKPVHYKRAQTSYGSRATVILSNNKPLQRRFSPPVERPRVLLPTPRSPQREPLAPFPKDFDLRCKISAGLRAGPSDGALNRNADHHNARRETSHVEEKHSVNGPRSSGNVPLDLRDRLEAARRKLSLAEKMPSHSGGSHPTIRSRDEDRSSRRRDSRDRSHARSPSRSSAPSSRESDGSDRRSRNDRSSRARDDRSESHLGGSGKSNEDRRHRRDSCAQGENSDGQSRRERRSWDEELRHNGYDISPPWPEGPGNISGLRDVTPSGNQERYGRDRSRLRSPEGHRDLGHRGRGSRSSRDGGDSRHRQTPVDKFGRSVRFHAGRRPQ